MIFQYKNLKKSKINLYYGFLFSIEYLNIFFLNQINRGKLIKNSIIIQAKKIFCFKIKKENFFPWIMTPPHPPHFLLYHNHNLLILIRNKMRMKKKGDEVGISHYVVVPTKRASFIAIFQSSYFWVFDVRRWDDRFHFIKSP